MDKIKYLIYILLLLAIEFQTYAQGNSRLLSGTSSCSTILFNHADSLFVGHNLDESYEVPGLVIVNPRGVSKREVSAADFIGINSVPGTEKGGKGKHCR